MAPDPAVICGPAGVPDGLPAQAAALDRSEPILGSHPAWPPCVGGYPSPGRYGLGWSDIAPGPHGEAALRWIQARGHPGVDAGAGRMYRNAAVCVDISLRERAEGHPPGLGCRHGQRGAGRGNELDSWLSTNAELSACLQSAHQRLRDEILARQHAQQAERAIQRELRQKLAQTNRLEAIGTQTACIAHDFNSILGIINGYAELLQSKVGRMPDGPDQLEHIVRASFRARDLVMRLLAFARQTPVTPVALDAVGLLRETLDMIRVSLPGGIFVSFDSALQRAPMVADPMQLHQLMMNLCNNAADAMGGAGMLTVRISASPAGAGADRCFTLTVADTGCGMSAETQRRIFEPFYTSKAPGQGSGLGLSMVRGIVAELRGDIRLHSVSGGGSRFDIRLPLGALN